MQRDAVSLLSVAMLAVVAAASDLSAQTITQLIVTHKTANVARAGTDSPFTLLVRPTTGRLCRREFPTYDYDERETGGTDTYVFDVFGCRLQREQVDSANVFVRTRGRNAWLPQHFKLIAKMVDGTQRSVVDRSWPSTNWFGADPSDAGQLPSGAVVKSEWPLNAPVAIGPSTVTFTLRQWTSGTSTWPQCTATITFSGSLQNSAPNAVSGQPSFSRHVSWSNTPATHSSGDQYYCDAAKTVFDLKAGSWLLRYQIQDGVGGSCGNSLPLSDATSGRINFTSGKTGCNTSFEFP